MWCLKRNDLQKTWITWEEKSQDNRNQWYLYVIFVWCENGSIPVDLKGRHHLCMRPIINFMTSANETRGLCELWWLCFNDKMIHQAGIMLSLIWIFCMIQWTYISCQIPLLGTFHCSPTHMYSSFKNILLTHTTFPLTYWQLALCRLLLWNVWHMLLNNLAIYLSLHKDVTSRVYRLSSTSCVGLRFSFLFT